MRISELLEKAETMHNAGELLDWAAKNKVRLTRERAELFISETRPSFWTHELSDDMLGAVTGGIVTKCKRGRCFIPTM